MMMMMLIMLRGGRGGAGEICRGIYWGELLGCASAAGAGVTGGSFGGGAALHCVGGRVCEE